MNIGHIQWLDMHDWKQQRDGGEAKQERADGGACGSHGAPLVSGAGRAIAGAAIYTPPLRHQEGEAYGESG